ncbi:MAG TPA: putative toxin-antitoxin system toxin component, PIN family [Ktedonobacteraceae bacterium]|nr:putative toxin-antitoxin system toxin component, PIN family [Ktedonobacteraceae bacterium]
MQPGSRIVVDTNVFVSRAMLPNSISARALRIVENHHILLASEATMEELTEVLMRPKLAPYIIEQEKRELFAKLDTLTEIVPIVHYITACRDPKDNKFLDVAVNGDAHCIITGDADVLALHPFRGISILTPGAFLRDHSKSGGQMI